jgi:putative hydrolase of the HAD superfamily
VGGLSVVLIDALGTLVALEPPGPHLLRELAARGVRATAAQAHAAMGAEIAYYRAEHHRADTPERLARLRRECAAVVQRALGPAGALARVEDVEAALLASVRFAAYPDAAPALRELRAGGDRLVVVSNWDVSLHDVLEQTGLGELVDGGISSAEAGVAKPDPAIFDAALALVGGARDDAVMVGDSLATDVAGAQAAGIAAVLVVRGEHVDADGVPPGVTVLAGLGRLPASVRYRRQPR